MQFFGDLGGRATGCNADEHLGLSVAQPVAEKGGEGRLVNLRLPVRGVAALELSRAGNPKLLIGVLSEAADG